MTDPKNESRYSTDEKFDALMTSFFEAELPAARVQQREFRTIESGTIETNRPAAASSRQVLVLVVSVLSLLVMANAFWSDGSVENITDDQIGKVTDQDKNKIDAISKAPIVITIPRVENRRENVVLPEGQRFGMNFSQVDERREHIDPKTGSRLNLTAEQYEIELYPIPEKDTSTPNKTRSEKPATKTEKKKTAIPKKKSNSRNVI